MSGSQEGLSDRKTDGASYAIKPWSGNDGVDKDRVALPKDDNLHAERYFLESVVENWWRYPWFRSQGLYTIYNIQRRGQKLMTSNGDGLFARGAVLLREIR